MNTLGLKNVKKKHVNVVIKVLYVMKGKSVCLSIFIPNMMITHISMELVRYLARRLCHRPVRAVCQCPHGCPLW